MTGGRKNGFLVVFLDFIFLAAAMAIVVYFFIHDKSVFISIKDMLAALIKF